MKQVKLSLLFTILLSLVLFNSCTEDEVYLFGSIRGTVKDAISLEPLSGVSITLSPSGKTVSTGSDGLFEFDELEAQKYTVSVSKDKYSSDSKSITVTPGGAAQADFAIQTANGALEISIPVLDFGKNDIDLGFDIKNIGKNDLTFEIENSYDWIEVSPSTGVISSTRIEPIIVTIDRSKIDENKSVRLPISSNAGSAEIEIKVDFNTMSAEIEISETILNFEDTNNTLSFDISNDGKSDLEFSIGEIGDWITFTPALGTIAPGELTPVVATIDRSLITESKDQNVTITSNAGSKQIEIKVNFNESRAEIEISETILDFKDTNTTLSFDISNNGNADLEFSIGEIGDWITFTPALGTIAPGELTPVVATIDRSLVTESKDMNVVITSNAGSKEIQLIVTKPLLIGILNVTPLNLDFGENKDEMTFTITNSGTAAFTYNLRGNLARYMTVSNPGEVIEAKKSMVVTVYLDRSVIHGELDGYISVETEVGEKTITVSAFEPINYGTVESCDRNIEIIVRGVKMLGNNLHVDIRLINNGTLINDFRFGTSNLSSNRTVGHAIDNNGNTYYLGENNKKMTVELGGEVADSDRYASVSLMSGGASVDGEIVIKDVDDVATVMRSIVVATSVYNAGVVLDNQSFKLSNVPIIRTFSADNTRSVNNDRYTISNIK